MGAAGWDGRGEHEGAHDVVAGGQVVVAEIAGHVVEVDPGCGDGAVDGVVEGFAGQHQIGGCVPAAAGVNEQDLLVVFDEGGDREPGGSLRVRAGHQAVQQGGGGRLGHHGALASVRRATSAA